MLRDSYADPKAGHHIEQVDLRFAAGADLSRVESAWNEMVATTVALQVELTPGGIRGGASTPALALQTHAPSSWMMWLELDRLRPLLVSGRAPWRAAFWPGERRFIWTLHHALLDGRSITRVLRGFLERIAGGRGEPLALSRWQPLTATQRTAAARWLSQAQVPEPYRHLQESVEHPASTDLGAEFRKSFSERCLQFEATEATVIAWCWGQAVTQCLETPVAWVEQVRAGAPQPGAAGFTMNTLPVVVEAVEGDPSRAIRVFREQLLRLREFETLSLMDLEEGFYPDLDTPECSVLMVEHATLKHQLGHVDLVEEVSLCEPAGESLTASAFVAPDFRLKVEGPECGRFLAGWVYQLKRLVP